MAFRWRADDGTILVVFGSTHYFKKKMAPLWKNFLDPHMQQKDTPACAYVRFAQCLCYSLSIIKWSDFHADIRMLNRILMLVNFGQGSRHWYHLFIFTLHRYRANTILSETIWSEPEFFNFLEVKKILLTQLLKAFYKDLFSISAVNLLQHLKHVKCLFLKLKYTK